MQALQDLLLLQPVLRGTQVVLFSIKEMVHGVGVVSSCAPGQDTIKSMEKRANVLQVMKEQLAL